MDDNIFSFSFLCAMAFVIGNANKMLLLLFEIKALIDRIVGAWKLKLGKNMGQISHATICLRV